MSELRAVALDIVCSDPTIEIAIGKEVLNHEASHEANFKTGKAYSPTA